jgi:hypothetical protein
LSAADKAAQSLAADQAEFLESAALTSVVDLVAAVEQPLVVAKFLAQALPDKDFQEPTA